jgi:hypothetical protein
MTLRPLALAIIDAFKRAVGLRTSETTSTPDIQVGDQINIDGAGDRFAGSAEVDGVSHEIGGTDYDENIEVKKNDLANK